MPEQTLRAFADHGEVARTLAADPQAAERTFSTRRRPGSTSTAITAELEREGVRSFCDSYRQLLDCIEGKLAVVGAPGSCSGGDPPASSGGSSWHRATRRVQCAIS